MADDLRSKLRGLPEILDVSGTPSSASIRKRGRRRMLAHRLGVGALLFVLVGMLWAVQPWTTWRQGEDARPATPVGHDYPFDYSGYELSGSGPAAREWLIAVDMPRDNVVCFNFFVEDSPAAGHLEAQSWCDGDVLKTGEPALLNGGEPWLIFHTFRPKSPEKIVFGAVTEDVAELVLDVEGIEGGRERSTPIDFEDAPPGFPRQDLRFFVVISPATADVHLRLAGEDGSQLAKRTVAATPTFARFPMEYGEKEDRVNGMVEIDAGRSSFCSDAFMPWAKAAHVHRNIQRDEPIGPDPIVLTLFEPPILYAATTCREADPLLLLRILDEPDIYFLDFHEADQGGRLVTGYLGEPSQTNLLESSQSDPRDL